MKGKRLDVYLAESGLVESREKARALIMAGRVLVDGKVVDKPGYRLKGGEKVELKEGPRFVSRAGEKLDKALKDFSLNPKGWTVLDVGSSTGGFTDCLLQHGAKRVYAVDVGTGQLDYRLRKDPRVVLYEQTDARELTDEHVPEKVDLITCDVSFISATKVLPAVLPFLKEDGYLLVLVKPQFELTPKQVRKGIVRRLEDRREAVKKVINFLKEQGFKVLGVRKAFPRGSKGNEEFFVLASRKGREVELEKAVEEALKEEPP
ncbi:MAG: TlyA family RNA methyltransferase [Aquificae bacterium]|nr:TlyA family RNA methyltransferase [Aquificota bacterium]